MAAASEITADPGVPEALLGFMLHLGDNTLILGHRLSEWCGHAPALEEDIALANTALDLIGQTRLWLGLAGDIEDRGRSADDLAFLRDSWDFRNLLLVERPNGDFGATLMRQFLFDGFHLPLLQALSLSADRRIADIAAKSAKEAAYHLGRSSDLVVRLGDGSGESHARMQAALDDLWPYTGEMFMAQEGDAALIAAGLLPDFAAIRQAWERTIETVLREATLAIPAEAFAHKGGRRGVHSEHLGYILAELQFLQRAYPGAVW